MNKGIPTLYRGVQYRSRLEARWAAFFDLVGWEYQYEPFDLDGWIPDFLLARRNLLVEIKPVTSFPGDVAAEMERAGAPPGYEFLILGCVAPIAGHGIECSDGLPIGWLRGDPPCWRPELSPRWGRAIVQMFGDDVAESLGWGNMAGYGLWHEHDAAMRCDPGYEPKPGDDNSRLAWNRIGVNHDLVWWGVYAPGDEGVPEKNLIRDLWNRAGNAVQWRGKRAEATW